MQSVSGSNVSQKTAIVMAGVSKIFVGEIVETGTHLAPVHPDCAWAHAHATHHYTNTGVDVVVRAHCCLVVCVVVQRVR